METPTPPAPPRPFAGVAPPRRPSGLLVIVLVALVGLPQMVFDTHTANKVGGVLFLAVLLVARLRVGPPRGGRR